MLPTVSRVLDDWKQRGEWSPSKEELLSLSNEKEILETLFFFIVY